MANIYESDETLAQYLHFHYGDPNGDRESGDPGGGQGDKARAFLSDGSGFQFPARTVTSLLDLEHAGEQRALDLGCAVGRSALELSRRVGEVHASDLSQAFIETARRIASGDPVGYRLARDGGSTTEHRVHLPEDCRPDRIRFEVGDALAATGDYHIVHASNLLCRLPEPAHFLDRLADLVLPGGQLALATPASWLETFTPRDRWPEGPILDFLKAHLEPAFDLVRETDLPFVIREHDRKFQLGISLGTSWRRR